MEDVKDVHGTCSCMIAGILRWLAATALATSRGYTWPRHFSSVPFDNVWNMLLKFGQWRTNVKPTKITRFIFQETWDSPASITESIWLSLSGLLYKMKSSLAPSYLCSLLSQLASTTTGYSFRKSGYAVPGTRKSSILSSFVPRLIVLWNALPKEIQESNTLSKFKTQLRTHVHTAKLCIKATLD